MKDENKIKQFGDVFLAEDMARYDLDNNLFLLPGDSLNYSIERRDKRLWLNATIGGLPRHPSQLYEAASYLIIFLLLMFVYFTYEKRLKDGFLFGIFLLLVFASRFFIEFLKENQESFEDAMSLNMGQILSIPFVIIGLLLIIWKWPRKELTN
jgi:prolipoprotein diacylglyceryltransferase